MASLNDELLDAEVRHAIGLQRLGSGVVKKIIALLNDVDADLVRQIIDFDLTPGRSEAARRRLQRLLEAVREIIQEGYNQVEPTLRKDLLELAGYEAEYQQKLLTSTVPVAIDVIKPSVEQLAAIVTQRPFEGALMRDWASRLSEDSYRRVSGAINIGFAEGETVDQMVRRIRGTRAKQFKDGVLEINRRNSEAIVRTAVNHVASAARDEMYQANTDLIKGWKFVATLDTRTTPICRALDGTTYKVGEGPKPPRHWGCRSSSVPIVKSWEELGIDEAELPPSTRASMNGQVPEDMTYGQWLRKQSRATVEDVMGKTKAKLFLDGDLPVDKFVNRAGDELTLSELRAREAEAFKRAGLS